MRNGRRDSKIVNVASVPKRSPFRYPGGKTWLVPIARKWLAQFAANSQLIEPFAGGAIIGLTAAFEGFVEKTTLIEMDCDVAAVWRTIISDGKAEWLAEKIRTFLPTPENIERALSTKSDSTRVKAFQTILRNRVQRGGILAPGAGLMKAGENGRGLVSRWYP